MKQITRQQAIDIILNSMLQGDGVKPEHYRDVLEYGFKGLKEYENDELELWANCYDHNEQYVIVDTVSGTD